MEHDDYVSLACLGFYEARARWRDKIGNFESYAITWMRGAIKQERKKEGRYHENYRPQQRSLEQQAKRLADDRARYKRKPEHCQACGVELSGRKRLCEEHMTKKARECRRRRARAAVA